MTSTKNQSAVEAVLAKYRKDRTPMEPFAPLDHLVYGAILDYAESPEQAAEAVQAIRAFVVDWNELRVMRRAELARTVDFLPDADEAALAARNMLNKLFDLRGAMDLGFLTEMKPAEARRTLLDLNNDLPRDIISLVLFETCPGSTLPLTPEALKVARKHGLVSRTGTKQQLQKALLAELDPMEAGELVQYLEIEAGNAGAGRGKRKPAKKTTKKDKSKMTSRKTAKKKTSHKKK